jgi:hypothetical protein
VVEKMKVRIKRDLDNRRLLVWFEPENKEEITFMRFAELQTEAIELVLQKLFGKHKNFYDMLGTPSEGYHPEDHDFYRGCDGFKHFMLKYLGTDEWVKVSDENLAKVLNAISSKIKAMYEEYKKLVNTHLETYITFTPASPNVQEKIDIQMLNNAILIANNGAYTLSLNKLQAKTLEDIKNELQESMQQIYNMQLQALKTTIEDKLAEIEEEKAKAKLEGLKIGLSLKEDWYIEDNYLVYKHTIYATKVKDDDKIYNLTSDASEKFFIDGLRIPLEDKIFKAFCDEAYHPNAEDGGKVCLGDLEGAEVFEVLEKLPRALEVANLDSAFPNEATEDLQDNFEEYTETDEAEIWEGE